MEPFKVTMFGEFSVYWKDHCIVEAGTRLNKPFEVLILLFQKRDLRISNEELMNRLWNEDSKADNPAGALKSAIYLLRQLLKKADPETNFIFTEGKQYVWNPEIPVQVDLWDFEDIVLKVKYDDLLEEEKLQLCRRAIQLYTGDFLPGLSEHQWAIQQSVYYRRLYMDAIEIIGDLLFSKGSRDYWNELLSICNRAILTDPFNEKLYILLFKTMQQLDMKQEILNYYPVVSQNYFDEMGEQMPQIVRNIYQWASNSTYHTIKDIYQIEQDLEETIRSERPINGAYFCSYEVFKHIFHMIVRSADRENNCVILMLLTLSLENGMDFSKDQFNKTMEMLKAVIETTMRKGDVFSRYSRNQFVLMLPVKKSKDSKQVEKRLRQAFSKHHPPLPVHLEVITGLPSSVVINQSEINRI
ncbi:MAG: winged helix-turn-helix domain-containing protein [Clostridiales bacterium]|nr:winged helix-turn-helix domain-containing protein [Clostridiales bacterium]MCI2160809.1 winged helix-turn-helix domain-containing protein [Oscillospiraceae bacterium]MCI1961953.1 winged helix-turn-helix domain-containing protein [Clostridiales bacterium]MCI2022314.1 winged helix-turn-helix domain-containing protein [Clostridiales bacterium]MCI2026711.1 winged helix-turn-helix domain-containing protein [Clostridiales bacterium]